MKISVVTICFNQAPFIEAALGSILSQKDQSVEYIVIDAGSTDGSRAIIEEHRAGLDRIVFEPDEGPADGLNKGFAGASGDYFYYLNGDDLAKPGLFCSFRDAAAQTEADVIYGNGTIIDESGNDLRPVRSCPRFSAYRYVCGGAPVLQQATFIAARAFRAVNGFNPRNKTCWDGELLLTIARNGGTFRHVERDWGAFRIHGGSITGSGENAHAYARERARLFHETMGRAPMLADRLVGLGFRALNRFSSAGA